MRLESSVDVGYLQSDLPPKVSDLQLSEVLDMIHAKHTSTPLTKLKND